MKDLDDYRVEWREPLLVNYNDYEIHLFHGAHGMASMLYLLEAADIAGMGHYTESPLTNSLPYHSSPCNTSKTSYPPQTAPSEVTLFLPFL